MNLKLLFAAFFLATGCTFFSAQENYNTLVFKGNQQFDKENYETSSSKYLEAVQLNDKEFMAHYNLGNPYNESIRKNYEIAMLKEKEKEQDKKQKDDSGGGEGDNQNKEKNKGDEKGDQPQKEAGSGQQNKGDGEGNDPNENKNNNANQMPKDLEDAILDRVGNKERETAKRILNKNSYSLPESNEKDW